jgi:putative drug exporter of the RND superfamily
VLDAIVVRSVLVTGLNLDLGRWTWWPGQLASKPSQEAEIAGERSAVGG